MTSKSANRVTWATSLVLDLLFVEVGDPVGPVRHEVHRLADPHRIGVLPDVVRDRGVGLGFEIVQPDVLVLAAFVALPVVLLVPAPAVEDLRAVRRVADEDASVEREALGRRAFAVDGVEVRVAPDDILEHRTEDDPVTVRRPADGGGRAGRVGQSERFTPVHAHDEDGRHPIIAAGEGDPFAVRGELGETFGIRWCVSPRGLLWT
jgi:hypothetical protein